MGWRRRLAGWIAAVIISIYGLPGHFEDGQAWLDWLAELTLGGQVTWLWWNYALIACGVLLAAYATLPSRILKCIHWLRGDASVSDFSVPIRDAIIHAATTTPHSFNKSDLIDRHFFGLLHEKMCSGKLEVIGRKGESGTLEHISPRRCKLLTPEIVVVPPNPSAPEGIWYTLVDKCASVPTLQETEFKDFLGLRVRARDLYRWWPK